MKEIKFRAWNKDEKVMYDGDAYSFLIDTGKDGVPLWSCWDTFLRTIEMARKEPNAMKANYKTGILMQFTGLKDKNGKEIYEGDLLDFDENEWGGKHIGEVTWNESEGAWDFGGGTPSDVKEWRQVIGNRYESPELLTSLQGRRHESFIKRINGG